MPLTDTQCRNAKPSEKPYKLSDAGSMYLLVMPNGSRYWRMEYVFVEKRKLLSIGVYPAVSLLEAREIRDAAKKQLAQGIDPSFQKQENRRSLFVKHQNTFEVLAREWHDWKKHSISPGYARLLLQRLELDLIPALGKVPIQDISPMLLLEALRPIEKRGAHEIAQRALQTCSEIFRYAIATGRAESNPAPNLRGALIPSQKGHFATIEEKELPAFLHILDHNDARLFLPTKLAIELMLLTFVRTSELINARWEEIDFDRCLWTIPGARMKMRRGHIVPLSKQALAILKRLKAISGHRDLIFPSPFKPLQPLSNNAILSALKRLGYNGRMTGHGFRALAMTVIKERLGYRHEVIDRQLAHMPKSKITAAYDRAEFLEERTKMMQKYADFIDKLRKKS